MSSVCVGILHKSHSGLKIKRQEFARRQTVQHYSFIPALSHVFRNGCLIVIVIHMRVIWFADRPDSIIKLFCRRAVQSLLESQQLLFQSLNCAFIVNFFVVFLAINCMTRKALCCCHARPERWSHGLQRYERTSLRCLPSHCPCYSQIHGTRCVCTSRVCPGCMFVRDLILLPNDLFQQVV